MKLGWRTSTAWRSGVEPTRCRQQLQEGGEVVGVERLGRRELPDDRPELRPELGQAAGHEALDRLARFAEDAPVGRRSAIALTAKTKSSGVASRHLAKLAALLRAVVGGVDLDRGERRLSVLELARLREARGIEVVAPRLEDPAADADADPPAGGAGLAIGSRGVDGARRAMRASIAAAGRAGERSSVACRRIVPRAVRKRLGRRSPACVRSSPTAASLRLGRRRSTPTAVGRRR